MLELDYPLARAWLSRLLNGERPFSLDTRRCYLDITDEKGKRILRFRYPLCINLNQDAPLNSLETTDSETPGSYALLLLQAGNAALATVEDGRMARHNVISKYVTRKKQGKAQLNYLKTKGKSRAGSRIRLANMELFLEEALDWLEVHISGRHQTLLYSCPPPLWGLLFSRKRQPPFTKKDPRLRKIPLDIKIPRFAEVRRARHEVERGRVEWTEPLPEDLKKSIQALWEGTLGF